MTIFGHGKTVKIEQVSLAAGCRERVFLGSLLAEHHDLLGDGRVVTARYSPERDEWTTDGPVVRARVTREGTESRKVLVEHGMTFVDDES